MVAGKRRCRMAPSSGHCIIWQAREKFSELRCWIINFGLKYKFNTVIYLRSVCRYVTDVIGGLQLVGAGAILKVTT